MLNTLRHFAAWSVGLAPAETQTDIAERTCLAKHVRGCHRAVEIGTWHGVTTVVLTRAMSAEGTLYAVDPYEVGRLGFSMPRAIARREVGRGQGARVEWIRTTGDAAARLIKPEVDFVFIDGMHTYEGLQADWQAWRTMVRKGGIIALHDSAGSAASAGSAKYTRDVISKDPDFETVEVVLTLTVMRRK
jgi:predicted O-methyltransferase YrrM